MSSFPLVSFLITLLLAAAVCTHGNEAVKDTNGNKVRISEQYFIQPVNSWSFGGGLIPAAVNNRLCPLEITQALSGQPSVRVRIAFPPSLIPPPPFAVVDTNEDTTIEFKTNICKGLSKFWEVDEYAPTPEERAVLIGGNRAKPNTHFKIEKVGEEQGINIYRFTTSTGTVGVRWVGGEPELVLTNDLAKTIFVKFIKVNDADATTTVTSASRVEKLGLRMIPF